ncbi:MAG: ABC transporter permease [Bacteroidetes bacterium]|nr:ABC transporter permease [Bacteroidota bacterium]
MKEANIGKERFYRRYGVLLSFIIIFSVLALTTPGFLSLSNLTTVLRQISINGILAVGVTFVIITGGIDLSLGSTVALAGVTAALFARQGGDALALPLIAGITTGLVVGLVNGLIVTRGKVAPFIVTLGMMTILRGTALVVSDGRPVSNLSNAFNAIGGGDLMGIPIPILVFLAVVVVSHVILDRTVIGRYVYATGGNEKAAYASGVDTDRVKMFVYVICGAFAGLAGIVLASRINTGQPNAGVSFELDAIAAAVIGGTNLSGGIGKVTGTVLGVLIIGIINNGLDLLNVTSYYQQIIKGVIIIGAVLIDRNKR